MEVETQSLREQMRELEMTTVRIPQTVVSDLLVMIEASRRDSKC